MDLGPGGVGRARGRRLLQGGADVPGAGGSSALTERVRAELPPLLGEAGSAYVWLACDTATTRTLTGWLRKDLAIPKGRVNGLGY
ncbi:SIP domain-containing protein [Streptomyces sp. NBC_00435]|uniref:SIP domain-containing protein n=1 Tax=Streptomyces sp. NBC_00435 TaxID=2903649 RepID=UPI003FA7AE7A